MRPQAPPTSASSGWKVRMSIFCSTHFFSRSGMGYWGRKLGSWRLEFLKEEIQLEMILRHDIWHKFLGHHRNDAAAAAPSVGASIYWGHPPSCSRAAGAQDPGNQGVRTLTAVPDRA